jgi:hypothetical protein
MEEGIIIRHTALPLALRWWFFLVWFLYGAWGD